MQPEVLAVFIPITLIITTGGVLLLRPITTKLGLLLEAMAKDRQSPKLEEEISRVREMQELLSERLALLEERQEFNDSLLRSSLGQDVSALSRGAQKDTPELRLPGRK